MSQSGIALWIASLFVLEVQHRKWIAWEHWGRRHHVKNKERRCKAKLLLL